MTSLLQYPNVGGGRPPILQCKIGPLTYIYVLCENHFDFHWADNIRALRSDFQQCKKEGTRPLHYIIYCILRMNKKETAHFRVRYMLALPIFPGRRPPSIVGANELNFCVRDGNRWTLIAINTNSYGWVFTHLLYYI